MKWNWIDSTPSHTCVKFTLFTRHLHFRHCSEYHNYLKCKIPDILNVASDTIYQRNYWNKNVEKWHYLGKLPFQTVHFSTIFWWWCLGAGSSCQVLWECHPSLMPTQIQLLPWQNSCLLSWFHWESLPQLEPLWHQPLHGQKLWGRRM